MNYKLFVRHSVQFQFYLFKQKFQTEVCNLLFNSKLRFIFKTSVKLQDNCMKKKTYFFIYNDHVNSTVTTMCAKRYVIHIFWINKIFFKENQINSTWSLKKKKIFFCKQQNTISSNNHKVISYVLLTLLSLCENMVDYK